MDSRHLDLSGASIVVELALEDLEQLSRLGADIKPLLRKVRQVDIPGGLGAHADDNSLDYLARNLDARQRDMVRHMIMELEDTRGQRELARSVAARLKAV